MKQKKKKRATRASGDTVSFLAPWEKKTSMIAIRWCGVHPRLSCQRGTAQSSVRTCGHAAFARLLGALIARIAFPPYANIPCVPYRWECSSIDAITHAELSFASRQTPQPADIGQLVVLYDNFKMISMVRKQEVVSTHVFFCFWCL